MMADKDSRSLGEAIVDCLLWVKSTEDHRKTRRTAHYTQILIDFFIYTIRQDIAWEDMFTFDTLKAFRKCTNLKNISPALIALSRYLHKNGRISQPLQIPKYQVELPDIYEQYLLYLEQDRGLSRGQVSGVRRVLASFHDYLEKHSIQLCALQIKHLDAFMAEFKVARTTRRIYLHYMRGFLRYLYQEKKLLKTDLAPLLVGPPLFAQSKPPRFLRPHEVQRLFAGLEVSTPSQIRTYAMVHLAYTLGLRPVEISRITLDDISFQSAEITIKERKMTNPITLPLTEQTIKAIALYVLRVRPENSHRGLFLSFFTPYPPIGPAAVIHHISKAMKKAGLSFSAYWLRHSYAQSLLQARRSIYEIKEMLGHENIQSTHRYLHIDTELMRKVLFNETL